MKRLALIAAIIAGAIYGALTVALKKEVPSSPGPVAQAPAQEARTDGQNVHRESQPRQIAIGISKPEIKGGSISAKGDVNIGNGGNAINYNANNIPIPWPWRQP